jgi:hypothetical protein
LVSEEGDPQCEAAISSLCASLQSFQLQSLPIFSLL